MSTEIQSPPLLGLVLAGGQSKRMGADKATLDWRGEPLWQCQARQLAAQGLAVAVSIRQGQTLNAGGFQLIEDAVTDAGPLAGFLSAWNRYPDHALLVLACDLPLVDSPTLADLLAGRDAASIGTAYRSANDGLPEPLAAIWEPRARSVIEARAAEGHFCPRQVLIDGGDDVRLLDLRNPQALENANTPEEVARLEALAAETEAAR